MQERIAKLERAVAGLGEELALLREVHDDLRARFLRLSLATIPEPRFPYWTWCLRRDIKESVRIQLETLLMQLDDRVQGRTDMPDEFKIRIPGVSLELLDGQGAPAVADIIASVQAVTGLTQTVQVTELLQSVHTQGMFQPLCEYYLRSQLEAE